MGDAVTKAKAPAQWVGNGELSRLMAGTRITLDPEWQTPGAAIQCACGFRATVRTERARDEFELEHRRYHDWKARNPEASR